MGLATPMPTAPDMSPLLLSSGWAGLDDLRKLGFVQTSFGPVATNPFVVKVSLPLRFEEGVPFYLYVCDANRQIELLISADSVVDELLQSLKGNRLYYCWAELSENGKINFDTETECPGW